MNYKDLRIPEKSTPSPYYNVKTDQKTGFLEFKPRDMNVQKKYDAYSPYWEGEESSNKAIASGLYDLDRAEKNREDLRSKRPQPKLPEPTPSGWKCIIQ